MNTYLVDYHFLDQRGNREDEHDYHTVEIEADNDDIPTIKSGVEKHLHEKDVFQSLPSRGHPIPRRRPRWPAQPACGSASSFCHAQIGAS